MNTLRSTERGLRLIALNCRNPSRKKICTTNFECSGIQKNTYKRTLSSSTGKNIYSSRYTFKIKSRIKTSDIPQNVDVRTLTTKPLEVPIFNSNKPLAEALKETVVKPIVPLYAPRFPKGNNDIPSVTKILSTTMPASSRFMLDKWKESMIKKLGAAGFNQYQQDTFERGRALHALLANYLLGKGEPLEGGVELSKEIVSNLWKSIQHVVRDSISNVRLVEHTVTHSDMNYRGIVDCVAFYKDELVVIDFKTAEKPKKTVESLFDNPLQVTAYCGAINSDMSIPTHVIDRNIVSGLVIVAYVDGSAATTYYLNREDIINKYWKQWVTRLDQFNRYDEMLKKEKQTLR